MKKIDAFEAALIIPIKSGKESRLSSQMKQLQPGEALIINKSEVKNKKSMYNTMRNVARKMGWQIQSGFMPDGSGYIVKRIK